MPPDHPIQLIRPAAACLCLIWGMGTAHAQTNPDCRALIVQACQRLLPVAKNQEFPVRQLQVFSTTTYRMPGTKQPKKAQRTLTWIQQADRTLVVEGETELYLTKQLHVAINHKEHTILITQPTSPTKQLEGNWIQVLQNQLATLKVTDCAPSTTKSLVSRRVRLVPLAASPLFRQIASVEYVLVGSNTDFQQITTYYLPDQTVTSAAMQLTSQQWKKQDLRLAQPVLERLFDGKGRLRPAYGQYTVSDYRAR